MITTAKFLVSMNSLHFGSEADLDDYAKRMKSLLEEYHPSGYSNVDDDSVIVEVVTYLGADNDL